MLTEKQVREYQKIYKQVFGKEISYDEAYEKGAMLVRLIELIYKPMTEAEYNQLQERRKETEIL